jgi:hypothetical protein
MRSAPLQIQSCYKCVANALQRCHSSMPNNTVCPLRLCLTQTHIRLTHFRHQQSSRKKQTHANTYTQTHIHIHTDTQTHTHTQWYTHTHTQWYTHTHTHTCFVVASQAPTEWRNLNAPNPTLCVCVCVCVCGCVCVCEFCVNVCVQQEHCWFLITLVLRYWHTTVKPG